MLSIESLITQYGYIAIAVGSFLEGETVVVLGGLAANRGYLYLPWVMACAFFGSLLGDQLYFYIGRRQGMSILLKRPHWQKTANKVFHHLQKHQTLLILSFRFLYGLRTITPFLIGASGVSPRRYAVLNTIGAFIWAISIAALGYFFGHAVELALSDIKHYEVWLFGILIVGAVLLWSYTRWRR